MNPTENKLKDPVCGREVDKNSEYRSYYGNGTYYFCSKEDKEEFDKQPEKYVREETVLSGSGGTCD